ncbi:hypothetical protein MNB_SV-14-808 [hydrothermal vent metagenome]|uniref:Uncharacterized protein n=1 Tax=hydrothermal vent metagenome TaxID=652676 RepID=A0A1W1CQK5_9ZZZZ
MTVVAIAGVPVKFTAVRPIIKANFLPFKSWLLSILNVFAFKGIIPVAKAEATATPFTKVRLSIFGLLFNIFDSYILYFI